MNKYLLIISVMLFSAGLWFNNPVGFSIANTKKNLTADAVPGEVLIKIKNKDKIYHFKDRPGIDIEFLLENYLANERIEYVEPNYLYQATLIPNDPDFIQQYYLRQVDAPAAWDISTGNPDVVVAVLDSGIDTSHPDLKHNLWINNNEKPYDQIDNDGNGYVDDFYGWNFVEDNNNINPIFENFTKLGINHGTIVSGVITARGNNGQGIAGGAWHTKVMNLKVLDSTGLGDSLRVTNAIDYAIAQGADIINLSLVGSQSSETLARALQRAWDAGLIIVAAAGNEIGVGDNMDVRPAYPVCNDGSVNNVIGVVAVDQDKRKANFSNYGSICSDVSAPGVNFYSTTVYNGVYPGFNHYYKGGNSGTSVAAPLVSAQAALIKSLNPGLTNVQIRNLILNTAENIDIYNPDYKGMLGNGYINFARSLGAAQALTAGISNPVSQDWLVTGAGLGGGPHVRIFDYQHNVLNQFFAYGKDFRGGVEVASGDIDGDGQMEIVTAAGPGGGPHIRIFDINGNVEQQFFAYDNNFRGGVNIAVGDVDNDGLDEIITIPASDSSAVVKIFDYSGYMQFKFLAYADNFKGGASLTVADVDGDGQQEIVTGAGPGGGPHVRVFNRSGRIKSEFFAFHHKFTGGVNLASSDIDNNGTAEIIVGAGPGGGPHVRVFNQVGVLQNQFFAFDPDWRSGVNVAAGDITGDGINEILTVPARGQVPEVRVFNTQANILTKLYVYNKNFLGGVNINILSR